MQNCFIVSAPQHGCCENPLYVHMVHSVAGQMCTCQEKVYIGCSIAL